MGRRPTWPRKSYRHVCPPLVRTFIQACMHAPLEVTLYYTSRLYSRPRHYRTVVVLLIHRLHRKLVAGTTTRTLPRPFPSVLPQDRHLAMANPAPSRTRRWVAGRDENSKVECRYACTIAYPFTSYCLHWFMGASTQTPHVCPCAHTSIDPDHTPA